MVWMIGNQSGLLLRPIDDGEAGHSAIFFRDPGCRIRSLDEMPHIAARPKRKAAAENIIARSRKERSKSPDR